MASQLVVTVDDAPLLRAMRKRIDRGLDPRPALEQIADDFLRMEREQFASQGSAGGTPWRPLSPEWAARKHGAGGILVGRSARMEKSLVQARARGSRRRIEVRSGRTSGVEMGSTQPLAHLHQGGTVERYAKSWRGRPLATPRYAGRLPARPVVAVGPADERRWRGILVDYLFTETRSMGL